MKTKLNYKNTLGFFFLCMLMVAKWNHSSAQVIKNTKYFNYHLNIGVNHTNLLNYYENFELTSLENYMDGNSDGLSFQTEAQVFYLNRVGLGLRYDYFANAGNKGIIDLGEPNNPIYANYKHSVFLHTVSPGLLLKTPVSNTMDLVFRAGLDFNNYRSPYSVDTDQFEITANTMGYNVGVSTVFAISNYFDLGINAVYRNALIDKIKISSNGNPSDVDLSGNDRLNLNRISIGVTLGMK